MRTIKLTIEYNGKDFKGWQIQPKGSRTVQLEIETALLNLFKEKIKITGSGRTDAGVHAQGQVAHFTSTTTLPINKLARAINAFLPKDIAILKAEDVKENFHAQYSAKLKTYQYTILNRETYSPIYQDWTLFYPLTLDLALIKNEAKELLGKRDFKSFQSTHSSNSTMTTMRTITNIKISKKGDFITVDITADGFLYKMVRNIVGTLLEIGSGKLPKGSIKKILKAKDRKAAGTSAKAEGLCLLNVTY